MTIQLPCLISVDGGINTSRLPSYKIKKSMTGDSVAFLTFADFDDQDPNHYGLTGSATQVERIFPPEKVSQKQVLEGDASPSPRHCSSCCGTRKCCKEVLQWVNL